MFTSSVQLFVAGVILTLSPLGAASSLQSRAASGDIPQCPDGSSWQSYSDDFKSMNADFWVPTDGMSADSVTYDSVNGGATFKIVEKQLWALINSTTAWQPPLNLSIKIQTSDAPGLVSQLAFRDETNAHYEVDLEIVHDGYELPIWHPNPKNASAPSVKLSLNKDANANTELQYILGTAKDSDRAWHYSHTGWAASQMLTYSMQWREDYIAWWVDVDVPQADSSARVTFRKTSSTVDFPKTPLPLHLGLWGLQPGSTWAGALDWTKAESYQMTAKDLQIVGCKSNQPFLPGGVAPSQTSISTTGSTSTSVASSSVASSLTSTTAAASSTTRRTHWPPRRLRKHRFWV